eukprot:COSAG01_NODE_1623_length_9708_cov_32.044438_11_plen_55_part_00
MGYSSSYEAKSHGGRQRRLQRMRSATGINTRIYHTLLYFSRAASAARHLASSVG